MKSTNSETVQTRETADCLNKKIDHSSPHAEETAETRLELVKNVVVLKSEGQVHATVHSRVVREITTKCECTEARVDVRCQVP